MKYNVDSKQTNSINAWVKKNCVTPIFHFPLCLFVASGELAPMPYEGKTNRKKLNVEHVICYKKKTVEN